jgi:DNA repair protein RadC
VSLRIRHKNTEQTRALYLDRMNKLIADKKAGQGALDHAPVYPREIARRALELSASAINLVHSHPSGDPTPSRADIDLTREIERALAPLEIKVHDDLVVGASETVSMKAKGLI